MKKFVLILFCWVLSLNLMGSEVKKFQDYFNSDIEFQLLGDYKNMISSSHPEKFYRTENNEYIEFVGVYELSEYDEIYDNFIEIFGSTKKKGDNFIHFENNGEKGVICLYEDKVWIKYLKRKN